MKPRFTWRAIALGAVMTAAGVSLAHLDASPLSAAHAAPSTQVAQATPAAGASSTSPTLVAAAPGVTLPNFTALVQRYGPAVVNINVTSHMRQTSLGGAQLDPDDPFSQFFRGFPGPFRGMQPRDQIVRGLGSGFIVSPEGYIMTNAHVVDGAQEVTVKLTDRREFRAKVIGEDKKSDIAIIKIDAKNLPVVTLGHAQNVQVGEWVLAIGSPYGFDNTVTAGIVSAKARALPQETYVPFIQTDVPVNPGNSGGPLFNMNGEVIGINSQIYSQTGGYQGLSFAIPIDIAVHVKDELIAHGKVVRGRLGVTIQDVNQQLANSFGLPRPMGALVSEVDPSGPSANSGLKPGDVITRVDGHEIDRSADLPTLVADIKPGTHVQLDVFRQGAHTEIPVTVGELNDGGASKLANASSGHGRLGLALRPLQPDEKRQVGVSGGLVVEGVSGPAADAGIQPGDVLLAVNGTPVTSIEQLRGTIARAGNNVAVLILRDGAKIFVPIDLG